jgi:hypothetical protein
MSVSVVAPWETKVAVGISMYDIKDRTRYSDAVLALCCLSPIFSEHVQFREYLMLDATYLDRETLHRRAPLVGVGT